MKTPPNKATKTTQTVENTDFIDLTDIISQGTENKQPGGAPVTDQETAGNVTPENQPVNDVNANHFEEPEKPKEPVKVEVVEEIPPVSYVESAKTMVMTLDLVGQIAFPIGYKAAMFKGITREEWRDLKDTVRLYESGKITETSLTEEQFLLVKQFKDYAEICKEVDFTTKEIDMLTNPLALMLQKYGMKSGPEATFLFAVVSVMGPRIMPMFIK